HGEGLGGPGAAGHYGVTVPFAETWKPKPGPPPSGTGMLGRDTPLAVRLLVANPFSCVKQVLGSLIRRRFCGPTGTSVWVSSQRSGPTAVMFTSPNRRQPTCMWVGSENRTQARSDAGMFGFVVVAAE